MPVAEYLDLLRRDPEKMAGRGQDGHRPSPESTLATLWALGPNRLDAEATAVLEVRAYPSCHHHFAGDLSVVVMDLGDPHRAGELLGRAIALDEANLGPGHAGVALGLAYLAQVRVDLVSVPVGLGLDAEARAVADRPSETPVRSPVHPAGYPYAPGMPLHAPRRAALRAELVARDLDALLVTDLVNVRYLTGFTGSNAALLVAADGDERSVFCTDGRYVEQSAVEVPDLERVVERACDLALGARAGKDGCSRVGFESQHVTVDGLDALEQVVDGLVRASGLVEVLRAVKDEAEVEALRMACAAADRALVDLIEHGGLRVGRTEREVARELESRMLDHGAAGPAFESIVAAGANSAIPHHRPTDAVFKLGDFVKLDFGALVDGYHSDMTRTLVLGRAADWQRDLYDLVARAQAAGRAALTPGADVRAVDAASRQVVAAAGHGPRFPHGLGHGVGLRIHEAPALSKSGEGTLSAGMAVTVEPGVYLSGKGGVRIEDTLVVRESAPELLTLTTKELVVV